MNHEETKNVYKKIFDLLEGNKESIILPIANLRELAEKHLKSIEYREKYDLEIDPYYVALKGYTRIGSNVYFGCYDANGDGLYGSYGGRHPEEGELLLFVKISRGDYHFGYGCPPKLFTDFIKEILNLGPKYVDRKKRELLFSGECAAKVYSEYSRIHQKYLEKRDHYDGVKRIDCLKRELIREVKGLTK